MQEPTHDHPDSKKKRSFIPKIKMLLILVSFLFQIKIILISVSFWSFFFTVRKIFVIKSQNVRKKFTVSKNLKRLSLTYRNSFAEKSGNVIGCQDRRSVKAINAMRWREGLEIGIKVVFTALRLSPHLARNEALLGPDVGVVVVVVVVIQVEPFSG